MAIASSKSSKSTRARHRKTTEATKIKAAQQRADHALRDVVRDGAASAHAAMVALRDAANMIVRAGVDEIDAVADATRGALRRFLASTERTTKSTARMLTRTARSTAGSARRAARTTQKAARTRTAKTLNQAVGRTARAARQRVREVLG